MNTPAGQRCPSRSGRTHQERRSQCRRSRRDRRRCWAPCTACRPCMPSDILRRQAWQVGGLVVGIASSSAGSRGGQVGQLARSRCIMSYPPCCKHGGTLTTLPAYCDVVQFLLLFGDIQPIKMVCVRGCVSGCGAAVRACVPHKCWCSRLQDKASPTLFT